MSKQQDDVVRLVENLSEKLDMLETNEKVLNEKAAEEDGRGRELYRAKNKRAAMLCFKRKKYYEQQIKQLGNLQLRIYDQMIYLEYGKASPEPVDASIHAATATKNIHKARNIDDVYKALDEINEQVESMTLDHLLSEDSEPVVCMCGRCGFADFDEDESHIGFKAEIGETRELKVAEEDEFAALYAELNMD